MNIYSISFLNYGANYNKYKNKTCLKSPAFQGNSNCNHEIESFLLESRTNYREIYGRPDSIVKIPLMSPTSVIVEDSLPISHPHLLLMYNDKFMYSLFEKNDCTYFHDDFKTIFNTLKRLYPKQNIVFFEHGSGNKICNGQSQRVNAGKSVTLAHGHFCVMPISSQSYFDVIFSQTKDTLSENNWENIAKTPVIENKSIPNSRAIFSNICYNQGNPPYLVISVYDNVNNNSKSAVFTQQNIDAHTPSQCLRKIIAEGVLKEKNPLYWDWKAFFNEINKGNKSDFIQKRIKQICCDSVNFEGLLKRLIIPKLG